MCDLGLVFDTMLLLKRWEIVEASGLLGIVFTYLYCQFVCERIVINVVSINVLCDFNVENPYERLFGLEDHFGIPKMTNFRFKNLYHKTTCVIVKYSLVEISGLFIAGTRVNVLGMSGSRVNVLGMSGSRVNVLVCQGPG